MSVDDQLTKHSMVDEKPPQKINNEFYSLPYWMIIGEKEIGFDYPKADPARLAAKLAAKLEQAASPGKDEIKDNKRSIRGDSALIYENAIREQRAELSTQFENKLAPTVPQGDIEGGFLLDGTVTIEVIAPFPDLIWKHFRKTALIQNNTVHISKPVEKKLEIYISIYRSGDEEGNINENDPTLYIWTRRASNIKSVFMRFDDLKNRLGKGAAYFYPRDYEAVNPLQIGKVPTDPFPLWDDRGNRVEWRPERWNHFLEGPDTEGQSSSRFKSYFNIAEEAGFKKQENQGGLLPFRYWNKSTAEEDRKKNPLPTDDVTIFVRCNELVTALKDWEKTMMELIKTAVGKTGFNPKIILKSWDELKVEVKIGAHPLGLYEIWVTKVGLQRLLELNTKKLISKDALPMPTRPVGNEIVPGETGPRAVEAMPQFKGKRTGDVTTSTEITPNGLRTAPTTRIPNELGVMGVSASEVAGKLWPIETLKLGPAEVEWLHRSAFSFGKLENLLSTQMPENLIFGTKETNTVMLRAENFIKRLSQKTNGMVSLKTSRPYIGWMSQYKWLSTTLVYEFRSEPLNQPKHYNKIVFFPFDRKMPLLFEAYLDAAVEELVFKWKDKMIDEGQGV